MVIPAPPRLEEPREEGRRALPRVVLPSVESAKTSPLPEPEIAPVPYLSPRSWLTSQKFQWTSATAPSPEVQTELHDVSPERSAVAALEPLVTEAAIDPLLALQLETEFSETLDERRASRSLLMRVIGMMLVLTLIAGAAVFHREVGHALIWLGQIIAGDDGARVPQSSVAEPRPASHCCAGNHEGLSVRRLLLTVRRAPRRRGIALFLQKRNLRPRAESSKCRRSCPPRLLLPTKTPSAPVLQPTSQQNRVPAPSNSSGTATDDGQQEYQQAEQILRKEGGRRNWQQPCACFGWPWRREMRTPKWPSRNSTGKAKASRGTATRRVFCCSLRHGREALKRGSIWRSLCGEAVSN